MRGGTAFDCAGILPRQHRMPAAPAARVEWTLRTMAGLTKAAVSDPRWTHRVRSVALQAGARNQAGQAAALLAWVRGRIEYVRDPINVEWVQGPIQSLEAGCGDCDDLAVAMAAALMAVGIPARFVAATQSADDPEWRHVWTEALIDGRWLALDASELDKPLGWSVSPQHRRVTLDAAEPQGTLGGIFDSIGDVLEEVRDFAVDIATLKYFRKGMRWAWGHMGEDMRTLVATIGPMAAEAFAPGFGGTLANAATGLLEADRLSREDRKKAKKALEDARDAGTLPEWYDADNPQHLEATWLASGMPPEERAAWERAHGITPTTAPAGASNNTRGLVLAGLAAAGLYLVVAKG